MNLKPENEHFSVEDPVKSFFTFLGPAWSTTNFAKQSRMPFISMFCPFGGFFALHVLYLCLLVCGRIMISLVDGNYGSIPQFLRLASVLFLEWSNNRRSMSCIGCIKQHFFMTSLSTNQYYRYDVNDARITRTFFKVISPLHMPEISNRVSPVCSFLITPPIAL